MILAGLSGFINTKGDENHEIHIVGRLVPPSLQVLVSGLIGLYFESVKGNDCLSKSHPIMNYEPPLLFVWLWLYISSLFASERTGLGI